MEIPIVEPGHWTLPEGEFHFWKYGKGENIVLAFHGFGQSNEIFLPLVSQFQDNYTIYSFDLFYHGSSIWYDEQVPLDVQKLQKLFTPFMENLENGNCTLIGFSMGGKFAIALTHIFPKKIKKLILIAPDGLTTSTWYALATGTTLSRYIFRWMTTFPHFFEKSTYYLSKIGVLSSSLSKFVSIQMNTKEKRKQVYDTWVCLRKLKIAQQEFIQCVNENHIPVELIVGSFDQIIPPKKLKHLTSSIPELYFQIKQIGHNKILSHWMSQIATKEKKM